MPELDGTMPKPQMSNMVWMMITLGLMLFVMFFRDQVGGALNFVFEPLIGFGAQYVVLTLIIAGMIMIGISTIIRTLMTDTMKQARDQREMRAFQAEFRQAQIENNHYKIKKFNDQRKEMMSKSMESSMKMMKTMPLTMIVVIPMFAWVNYFLYHVVADVNPSALFVAVPWEPLVKLTDSIVLPVWMFMYMLVTIPFGQLLGKAIRWFKFKKRLEEIERAEIA